MLVICDLDILFCPRIKLTMNPIDRLKEKNKLYFVTIYI